MRNWERSGEWCLRSGPWRIAKAMVDSAPRYVLTHDNKTHDWQGRRGVVRTHMVIGVFGSAKEAMEAAK